MSAKWENIIVHCSDSYWATASEIRRWHLENGWSDIGYHNVILNGMIRPNFYVPIADGHIEFGRMLDGDSIVNSNEEGAHALGYNKNSLGICVVGVDVFTGQQLNNLASLIRYYCIRFKIPYNHVAGHYEVDRTKSCPNIDMSEFRRSLDPSGLFMSYNLDISLNKT